MCMVTTPPEKGRNHCPPRLPNPCNIVSISPFVLLSFCAPRFCTTQHHADILVPDIHFHMRSFTANMLSLAAGNTSDGT